MMAPSHSSPEQVGKTIEQIIFLIDTVDNKVLLAYHEWLSRAVREHSHSGAYDAQFALLTHLFALKILLQNERRKRSS